MFKVFKKDTNKTTVNGSNTLETTLTLKELITVKTLNSGRLRVLKKLSVIERCLLLGGNLTKIIIRFGTKRFVRYSRHVRYLECPLLGGFTVFILGILFFFVFFVVYIIQSQLFKTQFSFVIVQRAFLAFYAANNTFVKFLVKQLCCISF